MHLHLHPHQHLHLHLHPHATCYVLRATSTCHANANAPAPTPTAICNLRPVVCAVFVFVSVLKFETGRWTLLCLHYPLYSAASCFLPIAQHKHKPGHKHQSKQQATCKMNLSYNLKFAIHNHDGQWYTCHISLMHYRSLQWRVALETLAFTLPIANWKLQGGMVILER